MTYILTLIIIQHGIIDKFIGTYKTLNGCNLAKIEALKHNNKITRVTATCRIKK